MAIMKRVVIFLSLTLYSVECGIFDRILNITDKIIPVKNITNEISVIRNITDKLLPVTVTFYEEENGHRMVEVIQISQSLLGIKKKEVVDCYLYGDRYIIEKMLLSIPSIFVKKVSKAEMSKLVNDCVKLQYDKLLDGIFHIIKTPFDFIRKLFHSLLIFPGTKWCGAGDVADGYDDIGIFTATDLCCRTHDHCDNNIEGFKTKHNLTNGMFYTKSHCDCDNGFHSCLYKGETLPSDAVGHLFFNVLQTQCFKREYPIKRCIRKWGIPLLRESCQEYEIDESKPKEYQFFDAKMYKGKHEPSFLQNLLSH